MTVVDLGSTNGVVVDGERVTEARLRDGTRIVARLHDLVFHEQRRAGSLVSEMSELTLTIIRLGFLAVLWMFVLTAVSVMRSDLFGRRTATRPAARKAAPAPAARRAARSRRSRRRASAGSPAPSSSPREPCPAPPCGSATSR